MTGAVTTGDLCCNLGVTSGSQEAWPWDPLPTMHIPLVPSPAELPASPGGGRGGAHSACWAPGLGGDLVEKTGLEYKPQVPVHFLAVGLMQVP